MFKKHYENAENVYEIVLKTYKSGHTVMYMLQPDSQPPAGFKDGYLFYTINIQYGVLRRPFVVNNL